MYIKKNYNKKNQRNTLAIKMTSPAQVIADKTCVVFTVNRVL